VGHTKIEICFLAATFNRLRNVVGAAHKEMGVVVVGHQQNG
jgi:hypothetical protein